MTTSKIHVNASQGILDVEGSEEFVERIYNDAKDSGLFEAQPSQENSRGSPDAFDRSGKDSVNKKKRTVAKRTGPACTDRILELKSKGYFNQSRKAQDVKEGLEKNGHSYAPNQVGAALTSLYKRGELRRSKVDGIWQYQQP